MPGNRHVDGDGLRIRLHRGPVVPHEGVHDTMEDGLVLRLQGRVDRLRRPARP